MRFAKMHGLGNDFVLLDLRTQGDAAPLSAQRASELCDRHRGIGADGVLTLLGDDRFVIQNADGSVPEMCGNGARCAALWIATGGGVRPARSRVTLQTDAGPRPCAVEAESPTCGNVEVEMGTAEVAAERELPGGFAAVPVSVGNPHRVIFTDGDLRILAARHGPPLCRSEDANIEFVSRLGPSRYAAVVWERGAGMTQACGTGACAVAAAAIARGDVDPTAEVIVELPGGALTIRRDSATDQLRMRGPAQLVFTGEMTD
ncbi:MAG TPA: diaminopimelate epimerase [Myxococcales bacterium]|nr:diaminopimelate epimerase [Myxococcales bacterium]